eukprot:g8840.t1
MPKRQVEEAPGSDVERDEDARPVQKTAGKKAKKQGDGSGVSNKIELGKNKFVDVRKFKDKVLVDIREYYEKDGEMRPGKKGIALTGEQWEELKRNMDDIHAKVEELSD